MLGMAASGFPARRCCLRADLDQPARTRARVPARSPDTVMASAAACGKRESYNSAYSNFIAFSAVAIGGNVLPSIAAIGGHLSLPKHRIKVFTQAVGPTSAALLRSA